MQSVYSTAPANWATRDGTLSGATTSNQSGPRSDGNEGVLHIPQSSSITGTSLSDCLVSYQDTRWLGSDPSAEKQSVYSTVPANWVINRMMEIEYQAEWESVRQLKIE